MWCLVSSKGAQLQCGMCLERQPESPEPGSVKDTACQGLREMDGQKGIVQSIHSKQKVSRKDDPETGGTTLIKVRISALDLVSGPEPVFKHGTH